MLAKSKIVFFSQSADEKRENHSIDDKCGVRNAGANSKSYMHVNEDSTCDGATEP